MSWTTGDAKPFAIELDPPATADIRKFIAGAGELWNHGAAMITLADCPFGMPRADSILLACKLHREYGMEVLPHLACRDRNFNAIQASLMGMWAEEVRRVLLVTGDPIPQERRDIVKGVFNGNSRKLISFTSQLNRELFSEEPFQIYSALNVNARNFSVELSLAQEKEQRGAVGFFTQPVLTDTALQNLISARQQLNGEIWGGIMPVISEKNARFLSASVSGISVSEQIISAYIGADRQQGESLAEEISVRIAKEMMPYIDGYYLMTPFGRTGLVCRIMDGIRALSSAS